jgi:hypothetical protein
MRQARPGRYMIVKQNHYFFICNKSFMAPTPLCIGEICPSRPLAEFPIGRRSRKFVAGSPRPAALGELSPRVDLATNCEAITTIHAEGAVA